MPSLLRLSFIAGLLAVATSLRAADDVAASTLTRIGQTAPDFTATSLAGESFSLSKLRGRVVVLSLFATWCPPCKQELPRVEKELWQALRGRGLVVLALAREENAAVVAPFAKKMGLTFPLLPDPDRSIYARYASGYIPRTYLIAPDGTIAFQAVGYTPQEFDQLVAKATALLARPAN
jgi:peroxiredoxin